MIDQEFTEFFEDDRALLAASNEWWLEHTGVYKSEAQAIFALRNGDRRRVPLTVRLNDQLARLVKCKSEPRDEYPHFKALLVGMRFAFVINRLYRSGRLTDGDTQVRFKNA